MISKLRDLKTNDFKTMTFVKMYFLYFVAFGISQIVAWQRIGYKRHSKIGPYVDLQLSIKRLWIVENYFFDILSIICINLKYFSIWKQLNVFFISQILCYRQQKVTDIKDCYKKLVRWDQNLIWNSVLVDL